ncbi:unnamed protein product [Orchesella dallaii]|uniref:C2H2-type domain-containing protein n=1 Tax=Orchesella dallaii TaxID=48710 RepID=A0ABP1S3D9_9HEXA
MLISSHNDSQNDVEMEGDSGDETICSEVRNHFVPRTPVDQSIVKTEVDELAQTESDANSDFMNGDDDAMNGSNSSESEWAPSEEAEEDMDPIDLKPDLATLMTSKDSSHELIADEEETNKAEPFNSSKETDGIDSIPRLRRRTLRSRKSKAVTRIEDHEPEDLAEIEAADETDEDDGSTKVKKKRKIILSDTESDPMSEEESDNEKGVSSAKEQFSCSICGVIYQTQHRAREHEEVHKRDDVFKCKSCKFVCLTNRGLKIHNTKLHSTSEPSEKSKAKKKIKSEYEDRDNEDAGDHSCSLCPVVYKTAHRLKEHEEVHQMENVYRCQVCGFACLKSRGIRIHARKYHSKLLNWNEIFDDDLKYNEVDAAVAEPNETAEEEYSCAICCAVYKTKHRLREHKRFHKTDDAVKCPECPYVCMTERQLFAHSNKQHSKSDETTSDSKPPCAKSKNSSASFQCILCPAKYQSENRFKQHSALHNDDSSFNCEVCGWVLATKEKLKYHMMFNHKKKLGKGVKRLRPKDGPYKCDHCPALYGTRNAFRNHVYDNHKDKLVQCSECDRCFESKQLLQVHIQKKACNAADNTESDGDTAETKKVHCCQQCSSSFKSQSKLRAHISATHEKKEFPCSVCSAVFPTESRYKFHMSRMHDKIHNVCKTCGYKAHGASHLRLHMQKHTKQKMYMCEICSKTFTSPTYLTGHKQKEHFQELGVQPIKCEECDVLLPSRAQLKYHNQKVHEKKFKYFCEICGKGFLFESGLKNHSQIHSTERNEVCQVCGAAYVHNRVLMDHMKNHHPEIYAATKGKDPAEVSMPNQDNQGPFICKFCNKEFSMRYHLHSHLKTHTEVYEKYKCGICGKGYSSVSGVKRHEESAHQSASYSCQYCGKEFPCRDYVRYHVKNHCRKKDSTTEKSDDLEETKHGNFLLISEKILLSVRVKVFV